MEVLSDEVEEKLIRPFVCNKLCNWMFLMGPREDISRSIKKGPFEIRRADSGSAHALEGESPFIGADNERIPCVC